MAKRHDIDAKNAVTLVELLVNPQTKPALQVKILNKLLEGRRNPNFFDTMFRSKMSYGPCPKCSHENHWLVPEVLLNEMGFVTADYDERVKRETTEADCTLYKEACMKKKVFA